VVRLVRAFLEVTFVMRPLDAPPARATVAAPAVSAEDHRGAPAAVGPAGFGAREDEDEEADGEVIGSAEREAPARRGADPAAPTLLAVRLPHRVMVGCVGVRVTNAFKKAADW
jgi:hypothetical protein